MDKYTVEGNLNYCAESIVVRDIIKFEELSNLVGVPWRGYVALVSKDVQVGDHMVMFPPESQLSEAVAYEHNLYAKASQNKDTTVKGYFGNTRRVKAIRLRGVPSNAFAADAEWFGNPPVGTVFDTVDGVTISQKFTTHKPQHQSQRKSGKQRVQFFPEHYDTGMYLRNPGWIVGGDYVTITQKLHGCFTAHTKVLMWDGSSKKISEIREGDIVTGFKQGQPCPSRVICDAFSTGSTDYWAKLKFQNPVTGDKPTTHSTPDHKFYTTNRGYVRADELTPGDTVQYFKQQPHVSALKKSILTGLMLGDGSIGGRKRNSVEWGHKADHVEYLEYLRHLLGNVSGDGPLQKRVSGYGTRMLCARTKALETVRRVVKPWESGVPTNLVLDDMSLAVWYLDDGSLAHSEKQLDRATFAICSFDQRNSEIIRLAMIRAGFEDPKLYCSNGYWRMRLNKDDAEKLFLRIRSLVPECMQYKLPEYHRGYFSAPTTNDSLETVAFDTQLSSREGVSSTALEYSTKWDITTETGNFVANKILVHNSSGRWGRVPVLRELSWKERLAKRFGVPVDKYEHQFVSGSRHVIKGISEGQQDFYDVDIWSEVGETIKDRIHHDVMVYGEIIGWIGDQPIQKDYTYRIPKGEWRMYVYRVSVLASDGTEYDLPWPAVEEFCENRQLETVKVLASGTFYDMRKRFDTDEAFAEFWMDRHFYDEGYDALPLSDDSPVDEGVVIRADNGITPTALKIKGPMFYEHESVMLDKNVTDIEEEQN